MGTLPKPSSKLYSSRHASEVFSRTNTSRVDGTLLEAWASVKSYQRKDAKNAVPPDDPGNATVDFHGEKRSNQTHASKTDPDAKMARKGKGKEAKLSYNGNLLVENRHGLIVNTEVFEANGTAERDAALVMLEQIPGTKQVTVGGDKGYDTADFVAECRNLKVTPHVAQNLERPGGSAIDARTTQHAGYAISQRKRKRVEECFGWLKTIALLRKVRHRGIFKVGWVFTFAAAAYNLVRMRNLAIQATVSQGSKLCFAGPKRICEPSAADASRNSSLSHKIAQPGQQVLSRAVRFSAAC
jgi:IS5 family transposase